MRGIAPAARVGDAAARDSKFQISETRSQESEFGVLVGVGIGIGCFSGRAFGFRTADS